MMGEPKICKEEFLKEFGEDYGYPNVPINIDQLRATDFKRLNEVVYLDHAGATLYAESQMEAVFKDLTTNLYGNPRILITNSVVLDSQSDASMATSDVVSEARQEVLDYFNASAKGYKCIFTSGATAALKLIGEAFPWCSQSSFVYTMENHNSVLGIREYALNQGARAIAVDIETAKPSDRVPEYIKVTPHPTQQRREASGEKELKGPAYNLFAFPSECNFSGVRFDLDIVKNVKESADKLFRDASFSRGCWMVLIDAAKGSSTEPLDLSKYPADFVVFSFYKLFGYPTGLGGLIVRNEATRMLKKTYFSGGTVAASIADIDFVKRREGFEESFEDGTISFLSIAAIKHGFKMLKTLTVSAISRHIASLTTFTRKTLRSLRHDNGASVCTVYGKELLEVPCREVSSIVTFNLKRFDGSWFGYHEVEKMAALSGIQLRTGCFCNPGACTKYLGLSHQDILSNFEAGHVCWDDYDIVKGKPTGAVRISFGYMSTFEDAKKFIDFVLNSFISSQQQFKPDHPLTKEIIFIPKNDAESDKRQLTPYSYLKSIHIYPIKSCSGFSVESWPMSSTGLQYDREWLLRSLSGEILTRKRVPEMRLIVASVDFSKRMLIVNSPRCKNEQWLNLESDTCYGGKEEIHLNGQRFEVHLYDDEVNKWFSNAIGRPCSLSRFSSFGYECCLNNGRSERLCRDVETRLSFVNEAQFLLINEESVSDLNNRLNIKGKKGSCGLPVHVTPMRFRPNLVIAGGKAYAEDRWRNLRIGNRCFTSLGGCNRCQMINLDEQEGQVKKLNEPLATLATYRRAKGRILFGILLRYEGGNTECTEQDQGSWLHVGDRIDPTLE